MCKEWEDYAIFKEWAYSHGYDDTAQKGMCTIDRIDNNNGYYPENCRFVDLQKQIDNQEKTIKLEYNGNIYIQFENLLFYIICNPKRSTTDYIISECR